MSSPSTAELVERIKTAAAAVGALKLMEVCGTHTVNIFRSGVKSLLPENVRMISGPGCPVCVTSQAYIDAACQLAARPDVTICTYGDMVRVPGADDSLEQQRSRGADIKIVYSARDAVTFARSHPDRKIVFLAVGFETTTPATGAAILEAERFDLPNFFIIPGHKLVLPAMQTLLAAGDVPIDGFLCPGHVSIVIGADAYRPIAEQYHKPCVITGFEPEQLVLGISCLVDLVSRRQATVENVYGIAVRHEGNPHARALMDRVFQPTDAVWRAIGTIPASGLALREAYQRFDALDHFAITLGQDTEPPGCLCGQVIQGKTEPTQCPLFAQQCTPVTPIGPCMVSSEGTCAAWYKYNR